MIDHSNKNIIIFNGEIYNYKTIKKELLDFGYKFSSSGDTKLF